MTQKTHMGMPRWGKWLAYLGVIVAVGALIWSQLPRAAYSTDLTRIGKGRPALVLAYDIQSMGGMTGMGLLDNLRGEYGDRLEFLVAELGVPVGRDFAQQFGAINGTVTLLSGDGTHLRTIHPPIAADMLRQAVEEAASGQTR
jgi:hypothetical protein